MAASEGHQAAQWGKIKRGVESAEKKKKEDSPVATYNFLEIFYNIPKLASSYSEFLLKKNRLKLGKFGVESFFLLFIILLFPPLFTTYSLSSLRLASGKQK